MSLHLVFQIQRPPVKILAAEAQVLGHLGGGLVLAAHAGVHQQEAVGVVVGQPGTRGRVLLAVMDGNFVRVMSWYDNEWGFSNRMSDTAVQMAKFL